LGIAEDFISVEIQAQQKCTKSPYFGQPTGGFKTALKLIDEQHDQEFSKDLLGLEPYTTVLELEPGDRLFACDGGQVEDRERGLFFIESGMLKIERDATETLTRGRNTLTRNRGSGTIGHLHARSGTVGKQRAAIKASSREATTQTFRLARIGPGWVCGAIEGASGLKNTGVHVAVTKCRVHHLPFQTMEEIEKEDPSLMLSLYKMLSHLMARRQEITIEQLATFHSIMSSPAHSKPVSRAAMMALRR
jgi:CRP-like cAMP-binding protein